ncbi:hypothetical protein PV11_09536 [Exophiala sideris]|uniref:Uncharacterized protein n=1 Tax=Exophiala sideris TaxID=1016849 RepID=A0A0D1VNZ9_9EURO|nr:hypothetical protein PV11_09536 [Exophiala sideris]
MTVILLLLAASTALAGPLVRRYENSTIESAYPTLAQSAFINGQPYIGIQSSDIVDIRDFATQYCQGWQIPDELNTPQAAIELTGATSAYMRLEYTSHVNHCTHSEPRTITKKPMQYCNSGDASTTCTVAEALAVAYTETQRYGYKVSLALKFKAGVPFVGESEITGTAEESSDWTFTDTTTETTTYTFPLKLGQKCAPTSIQFTSSCHTNINATTFSVRDKMGQMKHPDINNVCTYFQTTAEREAYLIGQGFESSLSKIAQICDSTIETSPTGRISLDQTEAGQPRTVTGCAFS